MGAQDLSRPQYEDKFDKLLQIALAHGVEAKRPDPSTLSTEEFLAREFARLGVCAVLPRE